MAPVLVDVPFDKGTLKAVVRQYIGTGTLNVKTARGEVKAQTGDILMTFIERMNDEDEVVPVDPERVREGFYTMVYPKDLFLALFPDAEISTKLKAAEYVMFDKDGEAVFMDDAGAITSYEGEEVMDTPENRARWGDVIFNEAARIKALPPAEPPAEPPPPDELAGL